MKPFLVLGGTGKVGRRVARRLQQDGLSVRTAARTGCDVPFDLDRPAGWARALEDVTAAFLMEPSLSAGTDRPARIPRLVSEAVAAGVRRLVLLSAPRAGEEGHPLYDAEQAVRDSGVDWTVLRPQWFAQNFSEGPWRPGVLAGSLALPTGRGRTPFVDAADIAAVAAAALTEDGHNGRVYELSGPRAISFGEAADLIARAVGRTVRHVDVAPESFVARQVALGVPPDVARLLTGLLVDIKNGSGAELRDGVQQALGRPPATFEAFVTRTAVAGQWG